MEPQLIEWFQWKGDRPGLILYIGGEIRGNVERVIVNGEWGPVYGQQWMCRDHSVGEFMGPYGTKREAKDALLNCFVVTK